MLHLGAEAAKKANNLYHSLLYLDKVIKTNSLSYVLVHNNLGYLIKPFSNSKVQSYGSILERKKQIRTLSIIATTISF